MRINPKIKTVCIRSAIIGACLTSGAFLPGDSEIDPMIKFLVMFTAGCGIMYAIKPLISCCEPSIYEEGILIDEPERLSERHRLVP